MSGVRRTVAGIQAGTRSFIREPFTVVLLVVLPALSIQIYGVSMGQFPEVGFFQTTASLKTTGQITGAVFATGALAGVLGLFQMISARTADRRLAMCGFHGIGLVGARFATVAAASVVVSVVATISVTVLVDGSVEAPIGVFLGLVLASGIYGLLGIVIGSVLPRELEGSLLLVILADVDNIFASGLFGIKESITRFAPLSHPHNIVTQAVVDGSLATEHLAPAIGHLSLFVLLSIVVYTYQVESGGDA